MSAAQPSLFDDTQNWKVGLDGRIEGNVAYAGPGAVQVPLVAPEPVKSNFFGMVKDATLTASGDLGVWGDEQGGALGTFANGLGGLGYMVGTALPGSAGEAAFLAATGPMIGAGVGLATDAAISKAPWLGMSAGDALSKGAMSLGSTLDSMAYSGLQRQGFLLNAVEDGVGNAGSVAGSGRVSFVDLSAPGDVAPGFYRANPVQLRFTQPDASPFFSKGGTIDSLVGDLRSGKVTADEVGDPLQVVMHENLPFSIDNRRLVAFNLAGVNDVPIQIVSLEDAAVAARFFDRFDPIGGVGQHIVITPSSGRTAAQMLLQDSGLIQGVQFGH